MNLVVSTGHRLYVDNWYSSPTLFLALFDQNTNACGTVKANRQGMPAFTKKLLKGQTEAKQTDKLLALKWTDRRDVHMLTTLNLNEMGDTGKLDRITGVKLLKPLAVLDYNENMGGVDKSDMMLSFTDSARRTIKWYKKFFLHLLDTSVLNSHVVYGMKTGKKQTLASFQLELVRQLLEKYNTPKSKR